MLISYQTVFLHAQLLFLSFSGEWVMQGSVRRLAQYPLGVVWPGHVRGALTPCGRVRGPSPCLLFPSIRTLFSETGVWEKVYQPETRRRVEEWWHPRIMARWRESAEEARRAFTIQISCYETKLNLESRIPEQKISMTSMCTKLQSIAFAETRSF